MQIGLRVPQNGRNLATKENIVYLAKQAENARFNSLWVLERLIWLLICDAGFFTISKITEANIRKCS
jgi:alkanesulfonate monooxygenase SsuD/methylene tetrahydromethanopterin reductase-like flavin-dependent oxidoreductase (luciferase family)